MTPFSTSHRRAPTRPPRTCSVRVAWLSLSLLAIACEPEANVDASVDASGGDSGGAGEGDLDGAAPEAWPYDGESAHDSGAELDASARIDAANDDAEIHDDASTTDAGSSGRVRSGEVVWKVYPADGTDFCPHQSIALWREETLTIHDPSAAGFGCYLSCDMPSDVEGSEATYLLATDEFGLFLVFRASVRLGYSTASFRENLLRAQLHWKTTSKTSIGSGVVELGSIDPPPSVEIVSYEAPLLHVRVQARSNWQTNVFREQATAPYGCLVQSLYGTVPTICTRVDCRYTTDDRAHDTHLTLDLQLPIEKPAP